jgi:hypothetical protein
LDPGYQFDHFTLWLIKSFLGLFHKLIGHRYKSSAGRNPDVVTYSDEHLRLPTTILSTILASILPIASIAVLYMVDSMPKRLGIVAAFTVAFSLALALLTTATRSENFAATAA